MIFLDKIKETAAFLKDKGIQVPEFGLILGSGLGELAEEIENPSCSRLCMRFQTGAALQ